jgi:hypothetical protein
VFKKTVFASLCILAASASATFGQSQKLAHIIPTLYGPSGLFVESEALLPSGQTHSGHFNSAFQSEFTQFNIALASQLTAVPLPSPASGFTYTYNETQGTFDRSTTSFGPILAERAETIGQGKFSFGFSYQSFTFDTIEGMDLSSVPAVFTHDGAAPGGKADVVYTSNSLDARVGQFTTFLTYGFTDSLDLSIGIPLVTTELSVISDATIERLGTDANHAVHFYSNDQERLGDRREFANSGSASGIGDVVLRLKNRALSGKTALAFAVDVRLPTGDEENLLGSGAFGIKPFVALSLARHFVSPHFNLGYQWNGKSVLAGDVLSGTKESLPNQLVYAVGVDFSVSQRVTAAFDVLGFRVFDSPQLTQGTFTGLDTAATTFPDISFENRSFNQTTAAAGVKVNPGGSFLVDFNLLFKLDDHGLRDKLTPLFGIEYSF